MSQVSCDMWDGGKSSDLMMDLIVKRRARTRPGVQQLMAVL